MRIRASARVAKACEDRVGVGLRQGSDSLPNPDQYWRIAGAGVQRGLERWVAQRVLLHDAGDDRSLFGQVRQPERLLCGRAGLDADARADRGTGHRTGVVGRGDETR